MSAEPAPSGKVARGLRPLTAPPPRRGREYWTAERTAAAAALLEQHPAGISNGKTYESQAAAGGAAVSLIEAFYRHDFAQRGDLSRRTFRAAGGRYQWVVRRV